MATRSDAMLLRIVVDNTQALREMKEFTAGMGKAARKTEQSGDRIERANKKAAKSVTTLRATWLKAGVAVGVVTAAAVAVLLGLTGRGSGSGNKLF